MFYIFLSIVISIEQPICQTGSLLRLKKHDPNDVDMPMHTAAAQFAVDFAKHVVGPLIGPKYIPAMVKITVFFSRPTQVLDSRCNSTFVMCRVSSE